jgi:hypothetical protein
MCLIICVRVCVCAQARVCVCYQTMLLRFVRAGWCFDMWGVNLVGGLYVIIF